MPTSNRGLWRKDAKECVDFHPWRYERSLILDGRYGILASAPSVARGRGSSSRFLSPALFISSSVPHTQLSILHPWREEDGSLLAVFQVDMLLGGSDSTSPKPIWRD